MEGHCASLTPHTKSFGAVAQAQIPACLPTYIHTLYIVQACVHVIVGTYRQTDRETDTKTDSQPGRRAGGQAGRQTDVPTYIQLHTYMHACIYTYTSKVEIRYLYVTQTHAETDRTQVYLCMSVARCRGLTKTAAVTRRVQGSG